MYFQQDLGHNAEDGYMAVDVDWMTEQWELMKSQPWFRGQQDRITCERELMSVTGLSLQRFSHCVVAFQCAAEQHYASCTALRVLPERPLVARILFRLRKTCVLADVVWSLPPLCSLSALSRQNRNHQPNHTPQIKPNQTKPNNRNAK